jgi:hypothetical protein
MSLILSHQRPSLLLTPLPLRSQCRRIDNRRFYERDSQSFTTATRRLKEIFPSMVSSDHALHKSGRFLSIGDKCVPAPRPVKTHRERWEFWGRNV